MLLLINISFIYNKFITIKYFIQVLYPKEKIYLDRSSIFITYVKTLFYNYTKKGKNKTKIMGTQYSNSKHDSNINTVSSSVQAATRPFSSS